MGEPRGPRRIRHRGPRRATGGTTVSQGEPQRLAGFEVRDSGAESTGAAGQTREGPEDARGRWLREQRPPHWG